AGKIAAARLLRRRCRHLSGSADGHCRERPLWRSGFRRGRRMSTKPTFPHIVIRASAGTGKTYQLAVRFIGLLAAGAKPEELLATTFTRKAAGEILDRVLFWLAAAAADDRERARLAEAIGVKSLSAERCRELLVATLRKLHALRVGTLDSYFLQVATSFGQE